VTAIKGIIFDCFGVLLADVLKTRIDGLALTDPAKAEQLRDIVRASNRGMLLRDEAAHQMAEILGIHYAEILNAADTGEVKNQELIAFIKTLHPQYKVALLSNVRGRFRLEERFDEGELDSIFDTVVASGDVGFIKPEPQIYELAARELGLAPADCVMIDDVLEFCDGAAATGMRTIQFHSNEQAIADLTVLLAEQKIDKQR